MRQQAMRDLEGKQDAEVPRHPEVPRLPLEQNRSTIIAARGDQEMTSRSMGRLSATQSEIYRDVFNDAAVSLVADIFSESLTAAEEAKKKAISGLICGKGQGQNKFGDEAAEKTPL